MLNPHDLDLEDQRLLRSSWEQGQLAWKLRDYQLEAYALIWDLIERLRHGEITELDYRIASFMASRKIGKSFFETLVCLEFGFRYPGSHISLIAPTAVEARDVFLPEFEKILADCPPDLRPHPKGQDGNWRFSNGSVIYLRGADMKPDRLRGPSRDLILVDEAAYVNRLMRTVESILYPMTINTRGVTLMCSTQNQSPNADYNMYHDKCEALGQAATINVYQAGFSQAQINAERKAVSQTTWEIEYECKRGRDPDKTVVPEWLPDVAAQHTVEPPSYVDELTNPEVLYWHRYIAADWGTGDNTAIVHGFYDWSAATIYVTGERLLQGAEVTGETAADAIRALEADDKQLRPFSATTEVTRVGDHNIEMLQSIQLTYGLSIRPVNKPGVEAGFNKLRRYVREGRLKISPSCANLLACMKHGAWKTVTRSGEEVRELDRSDIVDANGVKLGHFDSLMALVYLVATIDLNKTKNPLPPTMVSFAQRQIHGDYQADKYHQSAGGMPASMRPATAKTPGWVSGMNRRR